MSMLEFVKSRLRGRPQAEWRAIGKAAGVPFSTIEKIVYDLTPDPRVGTVQALHDYLQTEPGRTPETAKAA